MGGGQATDSPQVWLAKRVTKAQRVFGNVVEGFKSLKGSPREVRWQCGGSHRLLPALPPLARARASAARTLQPGLCPVHALRVGAGRTGHRTL